MGLLTIMLQMASGAFGAPGPIEWALVDVAEQRTYAVPDEAGKLTTGGSLEASPEGARVKLSVRYEAGKQGTVIKVHLADESGRDRGLVVRLSVPLGGTSVPLVDGHPRDADATAKWWQDLDTSVPLGEKPLANTAGLRGLPGLPEFPNGDRPEYGLYSVYPLGVVEQGGKWLALARPMSQLALVRFLGVGGAQPRLSAEVDLALSEFTNPPRQADFTLWFLSGDVGPTPALRQALARSYALQPDDWQVRVSAFGGWMPFEDLARIPNVDEFGFAYQEGAPNPAFDDALGALSFVYFHCAGEFANVPGYRRGTQPLPSYERIVAAFNQVAQAHTGLEGVWDVCGLRGPDGQIAYQPESTYGDFFGQACVDPDLPYGKAMVERLLQSVTAQPVPRGIDGVYYDGIAAGLDYAPEHLRAAHHLLLWDGKLGRPVNYNLWSSVEWSQRIHDRLTGTGKLTMLNDSSLASFPFAAPYIDVPGAEMDLVLDRATARLIRSLTWRRPFCTLVKADFSRVSQGLIETYMRRCAAYGILFGFFDISPSGDHPGSSYWEHPEWQDRDRVLFRRYMPLVAELAAAGWQPEPGATVRGEGAFVERFGGEAGLTYLTVSTDPREKPGKLPVTLALAAEPAPGSLAVDLLTGRIDAGARELPTQMTGDDLAVWAVGTPAVQSEACLARARRLLERRDGYLKATRAGGQLLTPWTPYGEGGARIVSPGRDSRHCLEVQRDEARGAGTGANQTIDVNHDRPRKLLVSAWSRADGVTGQKDNDYALYVDCYYTDGTALYGQTVPFNVGTHNWEYGERVLKPEKPVRNINVYLLLRGAHTGRVWFDDVQVALEDQAPNNLLPRGDLEPVRSGARLVEDTPGARKLDAAFTRLTALLRAPAASVDWKQADACLAEAEVVARQAGWEADTERTVRDVADLRWHLRLAQACLRGRAQPAQRESRLTPLAALGSPRPMAGPVQYRATAGKVPPGTLVTVDSNFSGYSPEPLTDGQVNPKNVDWSQAAWASEEREAPHWIELRFPAPTNVHELRVWWAEDGGHVYASHVLEAQVQEGTKWVRVEGQTEKLGPKPGVTVVSLPGRPLSALRLYQPPHGGPAERPDIMWVSEIEVE